MKVKKTTFEYFVERTKNRKNIICFGAGIALIRFLDDYPEYHLNDEIRFIVDNSKKKQGTVIYYKDKYIPIISPKEMISKITKKDIILVTTFKFQEVLKQLESYNGLEKTECYFYYFLRQVQDDYNRKKYMPPTRFYAKSEMCIPKTIHYCWFGKKTIPKQYRIWMESWRKFCPDYQIIEWNESNYDVFKNKYMRQAYEKGKWAFVSDFVRLDVIEQYGGVYLDTDVELIKNIDVLLKNEAFCGFESEKYVAFGLGFGAVKKHEIITKLKDDYEKRLFILENGELNNTTCPIYQTEFLEKYGLKRNGQFQMLKNITIYPTPVLCAMNPYNFEIMKNLENSYSIHHFSGSWLEGK